jgi:hypothetical protein
MTQFLGRITLVALLAHALGGCVSGAGAIADTIRAAALGKTGLSEPIALNPSFRYLRVTVAGRVVFLALGYTDSTPDGAVQVWYSAEREVIRLRDGRLVGATGLTREWQAVTIPPMKPWKELASLREPLRWHRVRDVQPGYRFGVVDALELKRIEVPSGARLVGVDATRLAWFEEQMKATTVDRPGSVNPTDAILPPAKYAIDVDDPDGKFVYAEQCLAMDLCLTWQVWSAEQQAATRR